MSNEFVSQARKGKKSYLNRYYLYSNTRREPRGRFTQRFASTNKHWKWLSVLVTSLPLAENANESTNHNTDSFSVPKLNCPSQKNWNLIFKPFQNIWKIPMILKLDSVFWCYKMPQLMRHTKWSSIRFVTAKINAKYHLKTDTIERWWCCCWGVTKIDKFGYINWNTSDGICAHSEQFWQISHSLTRN